MKNSFHTGSALAGAALALLVVVASGAALQDEETPAPAPQDGTAMQVQYLEIVTPDVGATCSSLASIHGVTFGEPVAELGNARTTKLKSGGLLGVRAPMHDAETPVVRPYFLVDDIEAATAAAEAAGGEIALPPMEIPGRGQFSIYMHGGIQHGLWQL